MQMIVKVVVVVLIELSRIEILEKESMAKMGFVLIELSRIEIMTCLFVI